MNYCIHCGSSVLDDAIICPKCGCSVQYDNVSKANDYNNYNGYNNVGNGYAQNSAPRPVVDSYSSMCIAGFILSFFWTLVGLILSIVAHNESKKTGSAKSLSLSKAGIIVSSVFLGIEAFAVIVCIALIIVGAGLSSALVWY